MNRPLNQKWIDCPIHPGHPCEVLSLTSQSHPPLYCVRCIVSDKFRPQDLIMLEDIMKCNEKAYVPNWPPFENQQKMFERLQEVKIYDEGLKAATTKLKVFMEEFKVQVCSAIDKLYQEILNEVNKKIDLERKVMSVYHEISSLAELKKEVERLGNLMSSQGPSKLSDKSEWSALREQIGKKTAQREINTKTMLEALEAFRKQKLSLDTESLDTIRSYIIEQIQRMSQFGWRSEITDQMAHAKGGTAAAASTLPIDKVGEVMKLFTNSSSTMCNDSFLKQVEECLRKHSLVLDQIDFTSIRKTAKEQESPFLQNKQHRNDIFNYNYNNNNNNNLAACNCNSFPNFNSNTNINNINQDANNNQDNDNNEQNNVNQNIPGNQKSISLVVNNNSSGTPLNSLCLVGRASQPQSSKLGCSNLLSVSDLVKTNLNQTETDTEVGRDNLGHLFVRKINSDNRASVRIKDPINNNLKYVARFIFDRRKGSRQNFYLFVGLLSLNAVNTDWSNNNKNIIFCNTKDVGVSKVLKGLPLSHQDVRTHYQEVEIRFCVKDRDFICLDYPQYSNVCGLKSDEKLRFSDEETYYIAMLLYLAGNEIVMTHFSTVDSFPPL